MKMAVYEVSPDYLQARDKMLVRAGYQWGLRGKEIITRIRVGVADDGQPGGAEVVTGHRELMREIADLEFE